MRAADGGGGLWGGRRLGKVGNADCADERGVVRGGRGESEEINGGWWGDTESAPARTPAPANERTRSRSPYSNPVSVGMPVFSVSSTGQPVPSALLLPPVPLPRPIPELGVGGTGSRASCDCCCGCVGWLLRPLALPVVHAPAQTAPPESNWRMLVEDAESPRASDPVLGAEGAGERRGGGGGGRASEQANQRRGGEHALIPLSELIVLPLSQPHDKSVYLGYDNGA